MKGQAPSSGNLTKIISLQQADGSWHLEQIASQILQKSVSNVKSGCPVKCDSAVWATVLALVYLEVKFASQKDEWELVAMKAEMWLEDQILEGAALENLKEAAQKCIS